MAPGSVELVVLKVLAVLLVLDDVVLNVLAVLLVLDDVVDVVVEPASSCTQISDSSCTPIPDSSSILPI